MASREFWEEQAKLKNEFLQAFANADDADKSAIALREIAVQLMDISAQIEIMTNAVQNIDDKS